MKKKIEVNEKCIMDGQPDLRDYCPIAIALKDAGVSLPKNGGVLRTCVALGEIEIPLPQEAQDFIYNFDDGAEVEPFSFELDIPEKYLKP